MLTQLLLKKVRAEDRNKLGAMVTAQHDNGSIATSETNESLQYIHAPVTGFLTYAV